MNTKQKVIFILIFFFIFSLTACSDSRRKEETPNTPKTNTTKQETAATVSSTPKNKNASEYKQRGRESLEMADESRMDGEVMMMAEEIAAPASKSMMRMPAMAPPPAPAEWNRESYNAVTENGFIRTDNDPLSTFSIDVDTASYSNVRRFINEGQLPPKGAVRIEEMINYFSYDYPQPEGEHPFSVTAEVGPCPWNDTLKLVRIGLKGYEIE